jgi:hypothetical protein
MGTFSYLIEGWTADYFSTKRFCGLGVDVHWSDFTSCLFSWPVDVLLFRFIDKRLAKECNSQCTLRGFSISITKGAISLSNCSRFAIASHI